MTPFSCLLLFFFPCSYRLRVESMLLKADFESNMGFLDPTIEAIMAAGEGQSLDRLLQRMQMQFSIS